MGNGNRHPVASKAQVAAGPDQVSGIVVHITGACPPGRGGGIIPVVFQAVVVAELNQQGWIVKAIAIVGGTERADCVIGHFFKSVGCFEKDACIFSLIPAPHNVCNLPDMVAFASGNDIVFHGGVERRGIAPAQLHVVPGAVDLVSLHHHIRSSSNRLIHGNERLDDYIRRGQGGQFFVLQEGAVDSIVAVTTVVGGV